jgi:beta-glucosidase
MVADLTVEEKVALVVGADIWSTTALPRIGLRRIVMSDGPAGVRGTGEIPGETAASLPAPSALAATWDRDLLGRAGGLFAAEARRHGVDVVLAPQINLQRTPVAGRHFECYSEDPLLTAELASALVTHAQRGGIGMCPKHFAANDSETERTSYIAKVDERTLREVYLAPFERLVADGAWTVMAAYSGLDDGHTAAPDTEHRHLLHDVLKHDWSFDGLVVSDWLATKSVAPAVRAGLDLQMPGPDGPWGDGLMEAVKAGVVAESDLDDKVLRLLRLASRVGALDASCASGRVIGGRQVPHSESGGPPGRTAPQQAAPGTTELLRLLAARSIVVLKDDDHLVPIEFDPVPRPDGRPCTLALLGPAAVAPFTQGGGSAYVIPDHLVGPVEAVAAALPQDVVLEVASGARSRANPPRLDVANRSTDPVTGAPGFRLTLLDPVGGIVAEQVTTEWTGWLYPQDLPEVADPRSVTLRLIADVRLDEIGRHELGIGTVGRHIIRVDGAVVSSSEPLVGEEIILASGHNHPVATVADVVVESPRLVPVEADLQVVHPVGYDSFVRGSFVHRLPGLTAEEELDHAVALAASADLVVVAVGTTEEVESEGFDRRSLALPGNQDELVRRVVAVNSKTIVIINAGAPVVLPWYRQAGTVLWAWLGGQECGGGIADVLVGVTEPSGRLPWTLPAHEADVPVPSAIPVDGVIPYSEGVHVGYRSWEREGLEPAACFGHGLGWTSWAYDKILVAHHDTDHAVAAVELTVSVQNTGTRPGHEVVQAYLEPPERAGEDRPVRWLAGFDGVSAEPGGSATARIVVPVRAFQIWDPEAHDWVTPPGLYRIRVGRSVRDLRLDAFVDL